MFAEKMLAVDPNIILVASGATPYEMNTVLRHFKDIPKRPIEYGSRYDWTGGLLEHSSRYIDYVAEHIYPLPDQAFDMEKQEFVKVDDPLVNEVRRPANRVKGAWEAWKIYEDRMPWLKSSDIKLAWDEWVSGRRGFHGVLGTATVLNEIFRHTELFKMSAYTCGPCALTYNGTESGFRGIGLVFKLYANNFATIPVEVNGNSPQKEVKGTVGVDKPEHSSGSDTYPLDVSASISEDAKTLTVAVVNATYSEQKLKLTLVGGRLPTEGTHWTITGPNVEAENKAGESFPIQLNEKVISNVNGTLTLAPITVNLFSFNLK
jgi:alpha-N-arabinofuranosidase